MKCQNCGKEEVNFHFTSNINGNVTEKHLCAECASKLGLMNDSVFRQEVSFGDMFADMFGMRPPRRMFGGYGMMVPTFVIPPVGFVLPQQGYAPAQGGEARAAQAEAVAAAGVTPEVDEDMKKRREVNILREQMRLAVEAEAFEKAAELRDKIKKIEEGSAEG
jgi:protein arginine kinase activator